VTGIREALPGAEVIVVDDGSTDATADAAADAGARVLRHDARHGYGAALRTGILASERPFLLFCDADGQHDPADAARVAEACDDCDMVVGARDRESHVPFGRAPGKAVLRAFADLLAGRRIPDLNSGLRAIRREVLVKYLHLMPQGFSFSTTTTFALLKYNYRVRWVPITTGRRLGTSTVRQWKHGPQTLLLLLRLTVLFEPLKVFMSVAGGLFVLSAGSLAIDLASAGGQGIADTTVLLWLTTLLVFLFGLLCDQVSAVRRELHD